MNTPEKAYTVEEVFQECLDLISKRVGKNFRFAEIEDLFSDCDHFFLVNFLDMVADGKDHEKLNQKVDVSITLRELITLRKETEELKHIRGFQERFDAAALTYFTSKERQKLSKFAADIGLTDGSGKRHPWFDGFRIMVDYLGAINGTDPELKGKKLSKREALERVAKRHGIYSADAVVSHLKRYIKKTGKKFPGILP